MHLSPDMELGRTIGRLETGLTSVNTRVGDLWGVVNMLLRDRSDAKRRRSLPWAAIIRYFPMVLVAASSAFNIVWPEPLARLIGIMAGMAR